jgi:hypothetical protein
MKIGDKVIYRGIKGVIIDVQKPRCKCKGQGKYIVDFGEYMRNISIGDKNLNLYNMEPSKGSLGFTFN